MIDPDARFFADLPSFDRFADVVDGAPYSPVPDSWHIAVTDVQGSTRAIEAGKYREVNAVGAGSIVAAINAAHGVELPYVFGGDGATVLVPNSQIDSVRKALAGVAKLSETLFSLQMRVGVVPITEIRARGADLHVARYRLSDNIALSMLSGGGAELADKLIKAPDEGSAWRIAPEEIARGEASLDGFHCRWNPMVNRRGLIASILVVARAEEPSLNRRTYRDLLELVDSFGGVESTRPVDESRLNLRTDPADYAIEAGLQLGQHRGLRAAAYRTFTSLQARLANRLMATGRSMAGFDGARYPGELVAQTDFQKFDDALRMILDLDEDQLARLTAHLEHARDRGELFYGIHRSDAALMTCIVESLDGNHVHFVDGDDGGYALAAKQLKAQMAAAS